MMDLAMYGLADWLFADGDEPVRSDPEDRPVETTFAEDRTAPKPLAVG